MLNGYLKVQYLFFVSYSLDIWALADTYRNILYNNRISDRPTKIYIAEFVSKINFPTKYLIDWIS